MSNNKISQREARRTRKELAELRETVRMRHSAWSSNYPGGTHIQSLTLDPVGVARADVARRLGFALVAKIDGNRFFIYAVKP